MVHNFKDFPELTNAQMDLYYFESPHKQIFEDFSARVIKIHDGDTITLRWRERDFDFPLRIVNIAAPELKEEGGKESQEWLESILSDQEIEIKINPKNRVEKWGRLLGNVFLGGLDIGELSVLNNKSVFWEARNDGKILPMQEVKI
jgi:endonuclease YncB( thermonuclease family)